MTSPPPDSDPDVLDSAGRALFHLGRAFTRLPRPDLFAPGPNRAPELGTILLTRAVADVPPAHQPVTVGAVAAALAAAYLTT